MKASMFYRIAAVLLLLFAAGHTSGFPWSDPTWGVDLGSMQSTHFYIMGFSRTYWDFYVGSGLFVSVFLLLGAVLAWQLGGLPPESLSRHAHHCVGVRPLLCRHHGFELEILFYYSHRFLNRDYLMFDCSGMALSEGNLKPFVRICSSLPGDRTRTQLSGASVPLLADRRQTGNYADG